MTKRNRILCLCLAILATAAVAFFLLYPHTTGPVLPRSGDAHIQAVELRADGELRVWSPKTEEDREKELVILDFLAESRQRHLLPNHETDWSGDASQRQYMLIVIQNGSNLVNIDLAQDDIVGEGPFAHWMTPTTPSAQQFDEVSPYAVFQPCDSPKYAGSYNKDFGYKGQVFSPKYKQSTQNLSKEARQVFNGAVGIGKHDKMNTQSYSGFFK